MSPAFKFVPLMIVGMLTISAAWAIAGPIDRDAGAKARGEFGGSNSRRISPRYSYRAAPESRRFSYESAAYEIGDSVVVTSPRATLRVGRVDLARLPVGTRLEAIKVEGAWVGAAIEVEGKRITGWVWNPLVTAAPAGDVTMESTPSRRYSYEAPSNRRYSYEPEMRIENPQVERRRSRNAWNRNAGASARGDFDH